MTKQGQAWRRDAHQTRASRTTCVHGSRRPIMSTNTAHWPGGTAGTSEHASPRPSTASGRAVPCCAGPAAAPGFPFGTRWPGFRTGCGSRGSLIWRSGAGTAPARSQTRRTVRTARHGTTRHGKARHGTARHGTARHGTTKHGMLASGHTIGENRRDSGSTGRLDGSGWLSRVNTGCIGRADCIHK